MKSDYEQSPLGILSTNECWLNVGPVLVSIGPAPIQNMVVREANCYDRSRDRTWMLISLYYWAGYHMLGDRCIQAAQLFCIVRFSLRDITCLPTARGQEYRYIHEHVCLSVLLSIRPSVHPFFHHHLISCFFDFCIHTIFKDLDLPQAWQGCISL